MFNRKNQLISLLTLLGVIGVSNTALAGPYVGVSGSAGNSDIVIYPPDVPGKEYSNDTDRQGHPNQGTSDPGQVVDWDGIPGVSGTRNGNQLGSAQIDALANKLDLLFNEVVANQVPLLFSTGISGVDTAFDNYIFWEKASDEMGVWATPSQIDQVDPDNVDGLEVWGPVDATVPLEDRVNASASADTPTPILNGDANRYSNIGDPGGFSIFDSNGDELVTTTQIASAIDGLFPSFTISASQIDLDALMVSGTQLLFSVAPIDGNGDSSITNNNAALDVDGGEIFVWDYIVQAASSAAFLEHGGHTWNTAFSVQDTVQQKTGLRPGSENIDALEAVADHDIPPTPEPSSVISLITLGLIGGGATLKRKFKSGNSNKK